MKFVIKTAALAAVAFMAVTFSGTAGAATLPKDANTTCPIMQREEVDPDLFVDYKGERIYLCCTKCVKRFNQDPEKYVARVHAQDAATSSSKKSE